MSVFNIVTARAQAEVKVCSPVLKGGLPLLSNTIVEGRHQVSCTHVDFVGQSFPDS